MRKVVIEYVMIDSDGKVKSEHEFTDLSEALAFLDSLPRKAIVKIRYYDRGFRGGGWCDVEDAEQNLREFFGAGDQE